MSAKCHSPTHSNLSNVVSIVVAKPRNSTSSNALATVENLCRVIPTGIRVSNYEHMHCGDASLYSLYCISGWVTCVAWFVPQRSQVNAQLFGLLVEMAAFEAKSLGGVGDVELMALQFSENNLALKTLRPFG
jgi:hypothetical protein